MERLPVKTFKNLTSTEMQTIPEDYGWDIIKNNERGYAFQRWCADLLCSYDQGLDTEPGDALLYSHDLGADLVLEDTTRKHLVVVQCKYHSLGKKLSPINEGPVNDFFNKHKDFSNSRWVREHGSEQAIDALGDYAEKVSDGYKIEYYFMSTGGASERVQELVENSNNDYQNRDLDVTCRLYEFNELKAFYVRAQSLEESIPVQVELQLPSNKYIIKDERRRTLIATIKGNTLRDLYRRYKEALFAYNIRGYLGDRGINKDTTKTAQNRAPDFFYFNNGVSAICTSMEFKDHKLIANKFQIINGAQTVGALYRADANPDIEVLMRVTETLGVASEKGINEDIILYNNSQNIIKVSDFRSNDPIQRHIEQLFKKLKPQAPLPLLAYVRKRGMKRRGTAGQGIKLEDLAKIRYAFKYEPTHAMESPRDLWTYEKDGGLYEKAFGDGAEIPEMWTNPEFDEALVAIAFYRRIEQELKATAKRDAALRSLGRLKFHVLSMAGAFLRGAKLEPNYGKIRANNAEFDKYWEQIWQWAYPALIDAYDAVDEGQTTLYALMRSTERWKSMNRRFRRYAKIP